jgi:hypothetical protein
MFSKIKLDGGSVKGRDGFNIGKYVPLPGTRLWVENNKAETERLTCMRRESRCSVFVESIKDRLDVGLMIEDLLTGHMPHHG